MILSASLARKNLCFSTLSKQAPSKTGLSQAGIDDTERMRIRTDPAQHDNASINRAAVMMILFNSASPRCFFNGCADQFGVMTVSWNMRQRSVRDKRLNMMSYDPYHLLPKTERPARGGPFVTQ